MQQVQQDVLAALTAALENLSPGSGAKARFETPKVASHGDWAVTAAMQLAKPLGRNPRELGEQLRSALLDSEAGQRWVSGIEVAGPGFLNLRLKPEAKQQVVREVLSAPAEFGRQTGHGQKLLVEFVSANPTGPLHVGHGRQ
ncbi:MAG: arginine--tRNA ligase, partial [Burkholderiales bacterium]|nr:arginine--tRNA ligase [Burkholderiales bacterium]